MKVLANPHIQKPWDCIMEELSRIKRLKHTFWYSMFNNVAAYLKAKKAY